MREARMLSSKRVLLEFRRTHRRMWLGGTVLAAAVVFAAGAYAASAATSGGGPQPLLNPSTVTVQGTDVGGSCQYSHDVTVAPGGTAVGGDQIGVNTTDCVETFDEGTLATSPSDEPNGVTTSGTATATLPSP
jgi:type 1 fimbria pilin